MKDNFVVIVRNGEKEYAEVVALCKNEPTTEWYNGAFSVIGNFDENEIKEYEYYDLSVKTDWQTKSGFKDRPL